MPMRRLGDSRSYLIGVGDKSFRIIDDTNMPSFIKQKLTMILASQSDEPQADEELDKLELYNNRGNPELNDIGWRASQTVFVIILSDEELRSLRGIPLGGFSNGTDT